MGNTLKRLTGIGLTIVLLLITWFGSITTEPIIGATTPCVKTVYSTEELPDEFYITVEHDTLYSLQEEIRNEVMYGEIELLAQLIEAEAGNQDELGKRYVADVPLNRIDDPDYPDKMEDVIFQKNPVQFSCTVDGNFEKAGWSISAESFRVAYEEYTGEREPIQR